MPGELEILSVEVKPFEPFAYAFIRFCAGTIMATHGVQRLFYNGSAAELGAWSGMISPTPGKSFAIGTYFRDASDSTGDPSLIAFVF